MVRQVQTNPARKCVGIGIVSLYYRNWFTFDVGQGVSEGPEIFFAPTPDSAVVSLETNRLAG